MIAKYKAVIVPYEHESTDGVEVTGEIILSQISLSDIHAKIMEDLKQSCNDVLEIDLIDIVPNENPVLPFES